MNAPAPRLRVVHLTAGTGSFFCGTCIRDNALVRALQRQGHDAELVPLYMPIVSEGQSCSAEQPILMSGVNVYLQAVSPLFRAVPAWMDSVLAARPLLEVVGRYAGRTRPEDTGALTVAMLEGSHGPVVKEIDRLVRWVKAGPKPDVIVLSNSLLVGLAAPLREALGVPVVCTIQGELHYVQQLGEPHTTEAWRLLGEGLAACDGRLAVSRFAAERTAQLAGLDPQTFDVVHNGIDLDGYLEPAPVEPPTIGFLARIYGAKGIEVLARAFIRLVGEGRDLRLVLAGTLNEGDQADLDAVMVLLQEAGVDHLVTVKPHLSAEAKRQLLSELTVFCVPSGKDETFGMYDLEAMAAGVPVVAPRRGALPEVLEGTSAVTWCRPDDPEDTARAISDLLDDAPTRQARAGAGREAVRARFGEDRMATEVAAVLGRVVVTAG